MLVLTWLAAISLSPSALTSPSTTLIDGGTVYNGMGKAPIRADVRIQGDQILEIGKLKARNGETVIRADGLAVAPGFIDAHSHADGTAKAKPLEESQIRQGITTAIVGQDGEGKTPFAAFLQELSSAKTTLNFAAFAGHGEIRKAVMGEDFKRKARPEEIAKMCALLEADMKAGALGLSSGLEYDPGYYSDTNELIEIAKVAARHGGMYISHVRDEGNDALGSFRELARIAKEGRLPAQISHIKLATASVWGKSKEVLRLIADSQASSGTRITADVYPYQYWQSTITVLTLDRNWDDRNVWVKALEDIGGPAYVLLSEYSPNPAWVGMTLEEIAAKTGKDAVSVIQEIIRKTHGPEGQGTESIVCTAMDLKDLIAWIKSPYIMFCSDGSDGGSHPRSAGSFPRILSQYVRNLKVISLHEAIRKMTSLPAKTFGLKNRGTIAKGAVADIVVFDPKTIIDTSTPKNPKSYAKGIRDVLVNGIPVLRNGKMTGARPGRVLLRN